MQKKHYGKEKMYALIVKWESSGISQDQFFQEHGIAKSTFSYWRKKYLNETGTRKKKKSFLPIKIANTNPGDDRQGMLEVVYPNGVRLVCSAGMDLVRLKPLIVL
jgi:hypothetical protein